MYQTTIDDEERLAYQDSLLREHYYLARLMKGNLRSVDSAYEVGKRFGIDWNHVEMRVMIFAIEETSELSATQWNSPLPQFEAMPPVEIRGAILGVSRGGRYVYRLCF